MQPQQRGEQRPRQRACEAREPQVEVGTHLDRQPCKEHTGWKPLQRVHRRVLHARVVGALFVGRIDEHAAAPFGRRQQGAQAGEAVAGFDARPRRALERLAQLPGLVALRLEVHRTVGGTQNVLRQYRRSGIPQARAVRPGRDQFTVAGERGVPRRRSEQARRARLPFRRMRTVAGMQLVHAMAGMRVDEQQALVLARQRDQDFEQ